MPIKITKDGDRYLGNVTPSHGGGTPWSGGPMTVEELVGVLRGLGCHETDIGDAFYDADPDWLTRSLVSLRVRPIRHYEPRSSGDEEDCMP